MPVAKVAISIDEHALGEADRWVAAGEYPSRSQAMQAAILALKEHRARRGSLLEELAKLDPAEERAFAGEVLIAETDWPAPRGDTDCCTPYPLAGTGRGQGVRR